MIKPITVVIADDHSVVRSGLRVSISGNPEIRLVGETGNAGAIDSLIASQKPIVLLLDLKLPDSNGRPFRPISGIKQIKQKFPRLKIIVISAYLNLTIITELLKEHIAGYILKDELDLEELPEIIIQVHLGKTYISPKVKQILNREYLFPHLSSRQREITEALVQNAHLSTDELAQKLNIAPQTLRNHLSSIYKELRVRDKGECIAMAIAYGIGALPDISDLR